MSYTITEDDQTACGTNLVEIPCEDFEIYELYTIIEGEETY